MLPTTLLCLLAATTVTALPLAESEVDLDKRICGSINMPTTLIQLKQNAPDTSSPNTARTDSSVLIYQDVSMPGNVVGNKVNELVAFTGPVGAYGCQLGMTFPSDYHFSPYSGAGSAPLNVYVVPEPLPSAPTWNNIQKGTLFGTVTPQAGMSSVINSKACPTAAEGGLAFLFTYADWVTQPASIGWTEYINALNGAGLRGIYLSYNC